VMRRWRSRLLSSRKAAQECKAWEKGKGKGKPSTLREISQWVEGQGIWTF
jgi:hypothetical protein